MLPGDNLFAWKRETALERVESCRVLLHVHGFLSHSESAKVEKRIDKWAKKPIVARKPKR